MQINILDKENNEFTLDLESTDTVLNVKSMIADLTELSIDRIRLIYNGKALGESQTVGDYNISEGATINIA